jgi:hypothetical protein
MLLVRRMEPGTRTGAGPAEFSSGGGGNVTYLNTFAIQY